jgi:hypothetical protein
MYHLFLLSGLLCRRCLLDTFFLFIQLFLLPNQQWRSQHDGGAQSSSPRHLRACSELGLRGDRSLSSCCQSHPQTVGCQSRYGCSNEKNYGCRHEYYSIRVLHYTQTHTHTHTHTRTTRSCLTSISLSFTHADTLTHTSTPTDKHTDKDTVQRAVPSTTSRWTYKRNHLSLRACVPNQAEGPRGTSCSSAAMDFSVSTHVCATHAKEQKHSRARDNMHVHEAIMYSRNAYPCRMLQLLESCVEVEKDTSTRWQSAPCKRAFCRKVSYSASRG